MAAASRYLTAPPYAAACLFSLCVFVAFVRREAAAGCSQPLRVARGGAAVVLLLALSQGIRTVWLWMRPPWDVEHGWSVASVVFRVSGRTASALQYSAFLVIVKHWMVALDPLPSRGARVARAFAMVHVLVWATSLGAALPANEVAFRINMGATAFIQLVVSVVVLTYGRRLLQRLQGTRISVWQQRATRRVALITLVSAALFFVRAVLWAYYPVTGRRWEGTADVVFYPWLFYHVSLIPDVLLACVVWPSAQQQAAEQAQHAVLDGAPTAPSFSSLGGASESHGELSDDSYRELTDSSVHLSDTEARPLGSRSSGKPSTLSPLSYSSHLVPPHMAGLHGENQEHSDLSD